MQRPLVLAPYLAQSSVATSEAHWVQLAGCFGAERAREFVLCLEHTEAAASRGIRHSGRERASTMTLLIIIFGLLGIGMVLVVYGTIAKNRWGINGDPVSCPRCNTPLPRIRKPQTLQQALWGGGTCPACCADVDKWGREVASNTHPHSPGSVLPEGQMRRTLKRRLIIFTAVVFFCLTLLFEWLGIGLSKGGVPSALVGWTIVVGAAAVETTVFTVLFYFASIYLLDRFFFRERGAVSRKVKT